MENEQLIQALNNCKTACEHCADACLEESDLSHMVECIRTDKVCATVCGAVSSILATSYANTRGLIEYCITVCEECASICQSHSHDHCQECAKACKECAKACKAYLN